MLDGPAVLSSGLLARKGAAIPASVVTPLPPRSFGRAMTRDAAASPEVGEAPAPRATVTERKAAGASGVARLSLRLDPERRKRLRIAAAHLGRSGQRILIEALDAYLERAAPSIAGGGACACLQREQR